ncbi:elongator complex protein 4 isoform X2 [Uranotaenia lowii]|nr:elongator complex protein 4 isoform X2 [Uranotaenia lowii]
MSNFFKRQPAVSIKGSRASLHSGQPIVSSGNPSLDHVFGGGFPIGSVIAIEEDKFANYSRVLTKYFLAEGIVNDHAIFLASLEEDPMEMMKKLPTPVDPSEQEKPTKDKQTPEEMRIAFRYNNLSMVDLEQKPSTQLGHFFDLSKQISESELKKADMAIWDGRQTTISDGRNFSNDKFQSLLDSILEKAKPFHVDNKAEGKERNLLRICLNSIGSPLWYDTNFAQDLLRFLTLLKAIVRQHLCTCLITLPTHLFQHLDQPGLQERLINLTDYCIGLESFAGSEKETNPMFKEYHGLLNVVKISAMNSLAAFVPETLDLAFKLRRRKFVIEKLHLPPELGEDDGQGGKSERLIQTMSCSGGGVKSKLEF